MNSTRPLVLALLCCAPLSAATFVTTEETPFGTFTITETHRDPGDTTSPVLFPRTDSFSGSDLQYRNVTADFPIRRSHLGGDMYITREVVSWPTIPDYLFDRELLEEEFYGDPWAAAYHFGIGSPEVRYTIEGAVGGASASFWCDPVGNGLDMLCHWEQHFSIAGQEPRDSWGGEFTAPLLGTASIPEPSGFALAGLALFATLRYATSSARSKR